MSKKLDKIGDILTANFDSKQLWLLIQTKHSSYYNNVLYICMALNTYTKKWGNSNKISFYHLNWTKKV